MNSAVIHILNMDVILHTAYANTCYLYEFLKIPKYAYLALEFFNDRLRSKKLCCNQTFTVRNWLYNWRVPTFLLYNQVDIFHIYTFGDISTACRCCSRMVPNGVAILLPLGFWIFWIVSKQVIAYRNVRIWFGRCLATLSLSGIVGLSIERRRLTVALSNCGVIKTL